MESLCLLSHPDRTLKDHTQSVIDLAEAFISKIDSSEDILKDILTIIAFSHDIGKSTDYFQRYIKGDKSMKNRPETKHAFLGGIVGFYLTDRYLSKSGIEDPFLLLLSFVLPKRHHSNLKNFLNEFYLDESDIKTLKRQIDSIDKEKFKRFLDGLRSQGREFLKFSLEDIDLEKIVKRLTKLKRFIRRLKNQSSLDYYVKTLLLFSILLEADKSDVGIKADKSVLFKDVDLEPGIVDNFISLLPKEKSFINKLRQRAFEEASNKEIDLNQKIYTLTLPTGLGKTLISFKFALKITKKAKEEKLTNLKIIYSLPFLSIIEQNFSVFEDVLKKNRITPDDSILLKHHHLTGFNYRAKDEEFDYDTSRVLTEGWNSKIIVTTFLQFFYSLIGNKNRMLRKFHRFANSVVILDEIQSIPHKYWLLLREILKKMAEKYNFYVILATATQPLIFETNQYCEIANVEYFKELNRYDVFIDREARTIRELYRGLELKGNKTYLFIMNTVNSAKELYELIKGDFKDGAIFLSTHIIPKERLKRIRQLKNKAKRISVSTQLVEAGVDVDFDVVYRDFAPFDSLNQSAGRCNRKGGKEKGIFNIVKLFDEENKRFFYSYIYDAVLINATDKILKQQIYTEFEFTGLVNEYFKKLSQVKSDKASLDMLEMLYALRFSAEKEEGKIKSIEDFAFIEEDYYKQDVFIEIDDEAKKIWHEYSKIWEIEDIFERKKAFGSIKADFYEYVVSVPIKENVPIVQNNFYYVPNYDLDEFYDAETGFITKGKSFYAV